MKNRRAHIKKKNRSEKADNFISEGAQTERGKKEIGEKINSIILHRRI